MNILFYISAVIAVFTTLRMITGKNAVHALLYLIVSLLAVAVIFFLLGAPFLAALEVIIYAGAIMVLFVFVIMMLSVSGDGIKKEKALLSTGIWVGPSIITSVLLLEMVYMLVRQPGSLPGLPEPAARPEVIPATVGALLFTKYIIVVELSAFLLVAGIIGAYHLGQKEKKSHHRYLKEEGGVA